MPKVLFLVNHEMVIYNFRLELVENLLSKGYQVIISSPNGNKIKKLVELGCIHHEISFYKRSTNPLKDIKLLFKYIKLIKNTKPDIVLSYTIKPNVYGGIASGLLKIPYLANVTGLGTAIEAGGILSEISIFLYKIGLRKASCVFFQNSSNKELMEKKKAVPQYIRQIPGSGVNLKEHTIKDFPKEDENIKFLFIGRLVKIKGIDELFEAAKEIKKQYPKIEFHAIGDTEEDYKHRMNEIYKANIINFHGEVYNVDEYIEQCHAVILPSYTEGMSNALLEAAASGRPVLASQIPGNIETFDEGISGFGFKVKSHDALIATIKKFINLPYEEKKEMGLAGRKKVEHEFSRQIIVNAYTEEIEKIMSQMEE